MIHALSSKRGDCTTYIGGLKGLLDICEEHPECRTILHSDQGFCLCIEGIQRAAADVWRHAFHVEGGNADGQCGDGGHQLLDQSEDVHGFPCDWRTTGRKMRVLYYPSLCIWKNYIVKQEF